MTYNDQNLSCSPSESYYSIEPSLTVSPSSSSSSFSESGYTPPPLLELPKAFKEKKEYACKHCSKLFDRPSALETHNYVHTREKPFQCLSPNCGRRFSVVSNLRRHFKVHQKAPSTNSNKLSSQDRIRCVRRLIQKNEIKIKYDDNKEPDNFYEKPMEPTNLDYKPVASQASLTPAHYLLLPPILAAEQELNTYFEQNDKYVSSYQYRMPMYNTNIDNSIERTPAYPNELNSLFTQLDEFSFLHL